MTITMKRTKAPGPRDGWYEISPSDAQHLLENGAKNRPLRDHRAAKIATDIQAGIFYPNGESVIFDEKGRLQDGQTRLRGAVLANKAILVYCVFDIPGRYFGSFDQGSARGGADLAALLEFQNYSLVAAVARLAMLYANGAIDTTGNKTRISNDLIRRYMEKNRLGLGDAATFTVKHRKGLAPLVPISHPAFVYYMTGGKAAEFVEKLATGVGLPRGNAVLLFRQRMTALRGEKHKVTPTERLAYIVKAWNAHSTGKPLTLLKWDERENFPRFTVASEVEESATR